MSFDVYIQIIFGTVIPAFVAIAIEFIFSNRSNKKKYVICNIGIWGLITVVISVFYILTKSDNYIKDENKTIFNNVDVKKSNQSLILTSNNENTQNNVYIDGSDNITITGNVSGDISINTDTSSNIDSSPIPKPFVDSFKSDECVPPNPVKDNIQINLKIYSSVYPNETDNYNNDKEKELLNKAKEFCESGKYDEAFKIYMCDELKDNSYAQINIAYLYAHGYGCTENIEEALKIYDSINMDIAKRNKLALLITSNSDGINDKEIVQLINYFNERNDYYIQNYITNCLYNKNVELLTDEERNITCHLKDLYVIKFIDKINSTRTFNLNQAYKKLVYEGLSYKTNGTGIYFSAPAYYSYYVYQYSYLNWLERIYT